MLDATPFDRDPHLRELIQRAVDEAARFLDADGAFIDRIHPQTGRMRTEYIAGRLTAEAAGILRGIELVPGEGLYGRAVAERSVLRTADYLQDESFPHTAAADDFARRVGITSVIAAPLVAGPAVFGVLGIYASRAEAFGDRQVGLAGALADHAAAAIAQSRLIAELAASRVELERRIRSEQTLRDITARIAAIRDPQDVLHRIADETRRLLGCDAVPPDAHGRRL